MDRKIGTTGHSWTTGTFCLALGFSRQLCQGLVLRLLGHHVKLFRGSQVATGGKKGHGAHWESEVVLERREVVALSHFVT